MHVRTLIKKNVLDNLRLLNFPKNVLIKAKKELFKSKFVEAFIVVDENMNASCFMCCNHRRNYKLYFYCDQRIFQSISHITYNKARTIKSDILEEIYGKN